MKKYLLLFTALIAFISCESTEVIEDAELRIVGNWKLIDYRYEMTQINRTDFFGEIRNDTARSTIEIFNNNLIAEFKYNPQFIIESGNASYVITRQNKDGVITKDTLHYESLIAGGEWNYVDDQIHLWMEDYVRIGKVNFSGDRMIIDVDMETSLEYEGDYDYKNEIVHFEYQRL
ncbi:hypothetical protein [Marinigracilibium pacificum]|uniref:Lipocalin-like protein n=1 Tax=Marinigracilibium pacificum TaxID=2729599 RepID=A0A848J3F0_9BACT|nr:hypothetical protein [Marinigracilibium pacificum]NMM50266.1 hypothetical protein [Marinigracilibium pacificum]